MAQQEVPAVLLALIRMLPPPGSIWPQRKRERWLEAAAASLDLVYGNDDQAPATPTGEAAAGGEAGQ